ncbi:gamma-glutamyltranspeptidase [Mytilinidion resinicola]|uniref:Glutathione hydrolase n=1 Tax=Mytilinidion resinicola TaxID=574789 RepID=A0A6A6YF22_9PEZI|nr:gamma-glutamyltranspeptidase [Mytilinidion resinicola]KAF2807209.1 gamma-glutamyltranspeptidase [Mytilinidion resinicola]
MDLLLFTLVGLLSLRVKCQHHGTRAGAVTSEVDVCSKIGIRLLKEGGNAADAAIGTTLCVGVIAMYHSGIGGGGFMNIRSPTGVYEIVDFRETAPAAAYQDMYSNNTDASLYGGLAVGVPGELRALEHLHKRYGSLAWYDLFAPSIKLAREGFVISADFFLYMTTVTPSNSFLSTDPAWALDFAPNGTLLGVGDKISRKRYADTLETVALKGPNAFYTGAIARTTIDAIRNARGIMTLKDLASFNVTLRKPVEIEYKGYTLRSVPAPASGAVVLQTFKVLEGYSNVGLNQSTHRLDEAIRFGYGERTLLGDPAFIDGVDAYQISMLAPETAAEVRAKISDFHTLNVSAYDPALIDSLNTPGTSQITAADSSGLVISLTTTINTLFGSQLIVPETGIILNNEMNDFSTPGVSDVKGYLPQPSNYIRPGKKPLSSMSPTIVEHGNGTFYVALGAGGGSRIITTNIQTLWHILDHNMTGSIALSQPRFHDQLVPNVMSFEYAFNNSTVAYLESLGHNVSWVPLGQSYGQAIRRLQNGSFEAASEPRLANAGGYVT